MIENYTILYVQDHTVNCKTFKSLMQPNKLFPIPSAVGLPTISYWVWAIEVLPNFAYIFHYCWWWQVITYFNVYYLVLAECYIAIPYGYIRQVACSVKFCLRIIAVCDCILSMSLVMDTLSPCTMWQYFWTDLWEDAKDTCIFVYTTSKARATLWSHCNPCTVWSAQVKDITHICCVRIMIVGGDSYCFLKVTMWSKDDWVTL
jgi:hypothetical protein